MKPLTLTLSLLAAMSLVFCATGCVAPSKLAQQAQDGLVSVGGDFADAGKHIDAAMPHTDPTGKVELGAAKVSILHGANTVPKIAANVSTLAAHDAKMTAIADDYSHSWFGGRTRFWAKVVMIVAGLIVAVIVAAKCFGWISTGGTGLIYDAFKWVGNAFHSIVPVWSFFASKEHHIEAAVKKGIVMRIHKLTPVNVASIGGQANVSAPLAGAFIK
jgi:hypothetical protein